MNLAKVSAKISLTLAAALVFVIPFEAGRNIDAQGLLLMISGGFAWLALISGSKPLKTLLDGKSGLLIAVIMASLVLSTVVNPGYSDNLLGATLVRLGSLGLFACIGIGLLCSQLTSEKLVKSIYALICLIGAIAVPYSLYQFGTLDRIGGVFAQADVLAAFLGVGFLLGLEVYRQSQKFRKPVVALQIGLLCLILLTQTRAVVGLLLISSLLFMLLINKFRPNKQLLVSLGVITVAIVLFVVIMPSRLNDVGFAKESVGYRYNLQAAAVKQLPQKPLAGYGLGSLDQPLACDNFVTEDLQTTCNKDFYFNSSHNIFLDRFLALGWIGGLAYFLLVVLAIYRGLTRSKNNYIFGVAVVFIAGYYLTNVTSLTLELLLWVIMIRALIGKAES